MKFATPFVKKYNSNKRIFFQSLKWGFNFGAPVAFNRPFLSYFATKTEKRLRDEQFATLWKKRWKELQENHANESILNDPEEIGAKTAAIQWFPGHMFRASREIEYAVSKGDISLLLEIRDARLPFTSANFLLADCCKKQKNRIIVMNKCDLIPNTSYEVSIYIYLIQSQKTHNKKKVKETIEKEEGSEDQSLSVVFINAKSRESIKQLYIHCIQTVLEKSAHIRKDERSIAYKMLVIGMPNVGKSTIINSLQKIAPEVNVDQLKTPIVNPQLQWIEDYKNKNPNKQLPFTLMDTSVQENKLVNKSGKKKKKSELTKTGPLAGVTRFVQGFWIVKQSNVSIFCLDTPGIMLPKLSNPAHSLKLALIGDQLVGEELIVDYLLYVLNSVECYEYMKIFNIPEPTDDTRKVLTHIAHQTGSIEKDGNPNSITAARTFLKKFRAGELGKFVIDKF